MYVPPYEAVLASHRTTPEYAAAERSDHPGRPCSGCCCRSRSPTAVFDEERYLHANPDVRGAMELGRIESGRVHYIGYGYFEGRSGGLPEVDEGLVPGQISRRRGGHPRGQGQLGPRSISRLSAPAKDAAPTPIKRRMPRHGKPRCMAF